MKLIALLLLCLCWKNDVMAQTPVMVKDINPSAASSIMKEEKTYPFESKFAAVGNRLYFACDDGTGKGEELCTSDGTAAGTQLIRDINPGPASAFRRDNERSAGIAVNGKYVFRAIVGNNDQLWVSGGCDKNTYNLRVINNGPANLRTFKSSSTIPGKAFFFASEVGPQEDELWMTDGTPEGTKTAFDACTTPGCGGAFQADDMGFIGSKVIYSASSRANTGFQGFNQLFVYDSSTGQGKQLAQLRSTAGDPDGFATGFVNTSPNELFFVAADDTALVSRLWRTDGNTAQRVSSTVDGIVPPLVASNGKVYFQARDPQAGNELHVATTSSVQLVKDLVIGNVHGWAEEITDMGNYVLFSGDKELYRSDGTLAGTQLVKDINMGGATGSSPGQSYPRNFIRVGNNLIFSGNDAQHGYELWISDGTTAGTRMLADIYTGAQSSSPQDFTLIQNTLYFSANNGVNGRELWKIDFGAAHPPPPLILCPSVQIPTPTFTDGIAGGCCLNNSCQSMVLSTCSAMNGKFQGINTNCAQVATQCNASPPPGACCMGSRCLTNQSPTSCASAGGNFIPNVQCSTAICGGVPMNVNNQIGACCKDNQCLTGRTQATCEGVFKGVGVQCAACFGDNPMVGVRKACCLGSGLSSSCRLGFDAVGCAGISGVFKDNCGECSQMSGGGPVVQPVGCTEAQAAFCASGCGGADKVANCQCSGINVSLSCKGSGAPTPQTAPTPAVGPPTPGAPNPTPQAPTPVGLAPTPVPAGATVAPFPAPNGQGFTQVQAPATNAQGQTITVSPGVPATQLIQPATVAGGVVPTDANGNILATVVIRPKQDGNGNVVPGQTDVLTPLPTPVYVAPTPQGGGQTPAGCTTAQITSCQTLCQKTGIKKCSCTAGGIDVECIEDSNTPSATATKPMISLFLGCLLFVVVVLN